VSGHIESGQINEYDGLCCKYDFVAGTDWHIIDVNIFLLMCVFRVIEAVFHNIAIRVNKQIEE
jgi:hypothetical protein